SSSRTEGRSPGQSCRAGPEDPGDGGVRPDAGMRSFRMLSKGYHRGAHVVLSGLWRLPLSVKCVHKKQPVARRVAVVESLFAMWSAAHGAAGVVVPTHVAGDIFAPAVGAEHCRRVASFVGWIGHLFAGAALGFGNIRGDVRGNGGRF